MLPIGITICRGRLHNETQTNHISFWDYITLSFGGVRQQLIKLKQ